MERTWPLTGRDAELAELRTAVTSRTGPRGMVLAGPAGVGKTRLAREAAAAARGTRVEWVRASAAVRALPLGAFADVVTTVAGEPTRAVADVVAHLTAGGPVVVVVDAHTTSGRIATAPSFDLPAYTRQLVEMVERTVAAGGDAAP